MLIYAAYPFANGLGCDFTADFEDDQRAVHVECFAGHMTKIYRTKITNRIFRTHAIYGKKGDTIFMIPLNISHYKTTNAEEYSSRLTDYIEASKVMSFKIFESNVDDDDIILWDAPVMKIYKVKRIGRLSFF
ncbi:hypothetical protein GL272_14040 [Aeromonas veronii]|uniref:hypothetical protein n=1 Tax=Aeromonas veronii TaxID=654 RepID=UPI0013027E23|nr:hypothetical protein [Aeromonas veronii]MBW3778028.1 hypothetical protein [Aeromonas veronii]